jgi:hypothetical protein
MPNISDDDLKKMDHAWQDGQPISVVRELLARALADLRQARPESNEEPDQGPPPAGSMPTWRDPTGPAGACGNPGDGRVPTPEDDR